MDNFFQHSSYTPLALRMAPKNFDEYQGQSSLVGQGKSIRMMVKKQQVQSMIFYGPPASGKTGLARIIAHQLGAEFITVNALTLNSDDIRKIHEKAQYCFSLGQKTILFIDEIHRLTRPKQDAFLQSLETGLIILIGATTENPYFVLQPALRSRMLIFEFFPLTKEEMKVILHRALSTDSILVELDIKIEQVAEEFLLQYSSDPRKMLSVLETAIAAKTIGSSCITKQDIELILQKNDTVYDPDDGHYNTISAFIKSIRGSDPDAALHYLAVMIESGEDPRFIFRRLLISATEDVGLAYPEAISIVLSCADAFERVGFPEGSLFLSQAVLLLAGLPKSNSVLAIHKAIQAVKSGADTSIPDHLKDSHYQGASELGYGQSYLYPHDYPEHFVKQNYTKKSPVYYQPGQLGFEKRILDRLSQLWNRNY